MATVASLAAMVGGAVAGDGSHLILGMAPLDGAGPRDLSFFTHPKYRAALADSEAGAIIVANEAADVPELSGRNLILCADPYLAMAKLAAALHPPEIIAEAGRSKEASIIGADVDASATVGPGAVIEEGATVGPRSVIRGGAYVGRGATVGADCLLHPGAKLLDRCRLGDRVILQAGAVIGSDGFGYAPDADGRRHKIPQLGIVRVEDDVEIGANATVDRATFGETVIGRGTKIDNLVQIAHNVTLGEDCVVVSQSGIAGSTRVGNRVTMGAQTGMVGHLEVCDDVIIGGRGALGGDVNEAGVYSGAPAFAHHRWLRAVALFKRLPEIYARLRAVERRLRAPGSDDAGEPGGAR